MLTDTFNSYDQNTQLVPAEVLEVIYTDSNPEVIYGIRAKLINQGPSTNNIDDGFIAVPLNPNIMQIPIVGEIVLLMKSTDASTGKFSRIQRIYYLTILNLQSSTHHNSNPLLTKTIPKSSSRNLSDSYLESSTGNSNQTETSKVDSDFSENANVKPLQPYIGDVIFSGRYGQSIRFSTTPKGGVFSVKPKFSKAVGAPITIFRNTKQQSNTGAINDFVTEKFTTDDNIIVMASGQQLEFEQSAKQFSSINSNQLTSWKTEKWGQTPQTLISSGRIIFNSTQKEIMAFAKAGIGLSSETTIALDAKNKVSLNATQIELGTSAIEPLVLGNQLTLLLNNLIAAINTYTTAINAGLAPAAAVGQFAPALAILTPTIALQTAISSIQSTLNSQTILSKTSKTK